MNMSNGVQNDPLNAIGQAILTFDTRWMIIGVVFVVVVFITIAKLRQKRFPSREEAITLALALAQLYSAPVLFSMLVLTQPPAIDLVSNYQRQGAGLLAFIFLVAGFFIQIKKLWTGEAAKDNKNH